MTRLQRDRNELGFTLVELLVVIAIIALLISILAPSLTTVKDLAKQSVCLGNMHATLVSLNAYAASQRGMIPPYDNSGSYNPSDAWDTLRMYTWSGSKTVQGIMNLASMYEAGIVSDDRIFFCPSMFGSGTKLCARQYLASPLTLYPEVGDWATPRSAWMHNANPKLDANNKVILGGGLAYRRLEQYPSDKAVELEDFGAPQYVFHLTPPSWTVGFAGGAGTRIANKKLYQLQVTANDTSGWTWADFTIWSGALLRSQ